MTGRIRIIAGQWRGRRLSVPEREGLRPTGDRVRETLFNWLGPGVVGARCLDLFAGTGALGLEAASRGAAEVILVERDRELAAALSEIAGNWPGGECLSVVHADAFAWLAQASRAFDLVLLDPPFGRQWQSRALDALVEHGLLAPGARVYVEQQADEPVSDDERFEILRDKRIGGIRARLLRPVHAGSV